MNEQAIDAVVEKYLMQSMPMWAAYVNIKVSPFLKSFLVEMRGQGNAFSHRYIIDLRLLKSYSDVLWIDEDFRGKGIGRGLVEVREATCSEFGTERIIIGLVDNPQFWSHMGYSFIADEEHEMLLRNRVRDRDYSIHNSPLEKPMFKDLRK